MKIIKTSFFLLLKTSILLSVFNAEGQKTTIYGTVKDSATGETLIGAIIQVKATNLSVASNTYGFYSLTMPKGVYVLECSYIGYKSIHETLTLNSNLSHNMYLAPKANELQEVIVTESKDFSHKTAVSRLQVNIEQIKAIPNITGESDVLKSIQLLPGVQTANEGTSNINVRGGSNDQNLILLDEAPVYNATHALGFYSVFNTDVLKSVTFYKGGFPAQYGGRLSSVLDISMKEGNMHEYKGSGGIGLDASRFTLEGPLIKDTASFVLSGRYCYAGHVFNLLLAKALSNKNEINFYDLNAKVNYILNDHNRLYISAYSGSDHFFSRILDDNNALDWGNTTTTMRWNHIFSSRTFSNLTFYYSNYHYAYQIREDIRKFFWKAGIREAGIKKDISVFLSNRHSVKLGVSGTFQKFDPGDITPDGSNSLVNPASLPSKRSITSAGYIQDDLLLASWLSMNLGLRYSLFLNIGSGTAYKYDNTMSQIVDSTHYSNNAVINTYSNLEPRFSASFLINPDNSIKVSYSRVTQYLQLLSNSTAGLPTDMWLPPDNNIRPLLSNQYVLGYYLNLFSGRAVFSAESYLKDLKGIIDFKDNTDFFMDNHVETKVLSGNGYSYGSELLLEKKHGILNGWIGYTFSRTLYKINGINNNAWYHPPFDITHNLSVVGQYVINKKMSFASTFKITSGGYVTMPTGSFVYNDIAFPQYDGRNNYQLPVYQRLDIALTYKPENKNHRKWNGEWVFSVYNIYNHKNVFAMFVRQDDYEAITNHAYFMYLFGTIPMVSYNFNF